MYHMIGFNKFQAFLMLCTHKFRVILWIKTSNKFFFLRTPCRHIGGMEVQPLSFLSWALHLCEFSNFICHPLHSLWECSNFIHQPLHSLWECSIFIRQPLHSVWENARFSFNTRMGGLQSQYRHYEEEKNLVFDIQVTVHRDIFL